MALIRGLHHLTMSVGPAQEDYDFHTGVLGPGHHVRNPRGDLLVAAGTAVGLALRARARHMAHAPLLALPALRGLPAAVPIGPVLVRAATGGTGGLGSITARGHSTPHWV